MEKKYYGVYQGIVTNTKDPEKRGRIKVLCPAILNAKVESAWCDPCVPIAYDNGGDFCIPQIDEAVWLMFIEGDSNKPVYLGGWWRKEKTPFGMNYDDGADSTRIISYADCTITMIDGKITINVGEKDTSLIIEDGKVQIKGDVEITGALKATGNVDLKGDVNITGALNVTDDTTKVSITESKIVMNVGDGVGEVTIIDDKVKVIGNMEVTRTLTSNTEQEYTQKTNG